MKHLTLVLLVASAVVLPGCIGTRLQPGAEKIQILHAPADAAGKVYVSDTMGSCGSWWNSLFMTYAYQYRNATNVLKNNALEHQGSAVLVSGVVPSYTSLVFYGTIYSDKK